MKLIFLLFTQWNIKFSSIDVFAVTWLQIFHLYLILKLQSLQSQFHCAPSSGCEEEINFPLNHLFSIISLFYKGVKHARFLP